MTYPVDVRILQVHIGPIREHAFIRAEVAGLAADLGTWRVSIGAKVLRWDLFKESETQQDQHDAHNCASGDYSLKVLISAKATDRSKNFINLYVN